MYFSSLQQIQLQDNPKPSISITLGTFAKVTHHTTYQPPDPNLRMPGPKNDWHNPEWISGFVPIELFRRYEERGR